MWLEGGAAESAAPTRISHTRDGRSHRRLPEGPSTPHAGSVWRCRGTRCRRRWILVCTQNPRRARTGCMRSRLRFRCTPRSAGRPSRARVSLGSGLLRWPGARLATHQPKSKRTQWHGMRPSQTAEIRRLGSPRPGGTWLAQGGSSSRDTKFSCSYPTPPPSEFQSRSECLPAPSKKRPCCRPEFECT